MVHWQEPPLIFNFGSDESEADKRDPLLDQWYQYDMVLDEAEGMEPAAVPVPMAVPAPAPVVMPVALMTWFVATVVALEAAGIYEVPVLVPAALPGCDATIDAFIGTLLPSLHCHPLTRSSWRTFRPSSPSLKHGLTSLSTRTPVDPAATAMDVVFIVVSYLV